jgi:4-amino-4-deoxy-L-arabinose transferase-like glycosyltransferase
MNRRGPISATGDAIWPVNRLAERMRNSLGDPARRDRTVAAMLLAYVAVWTAYGVIAKGSQDIHIDMSEQFMLARDLAFGYAKHPPLTMLIVRAWFGVFPATDWAYYLLAMANAALALWICWRLCGEFLADDKRALGLALLTFVPFFNFHALKFNPNTVLIPLWAATTWFFLRSFAGRRALDAAFAGLCAAAAMYGKYWSFVLLLALGIAALADPRRAQYFRSAAPWITVLAGAAAITPHVVWLFANDFAPFSYAVLVHGEASPTAALAGVAGYLSGSLAYVAVPIGFVALAARPDRKALKDMAWPAAGERRLAASAFWAMLLVPAVIAPLAGVRLTSLWSMSAWALLPVMLLSSPLVVISRSDAARILAVAAAFPLAMLAIAPAVGMVVSHSGMPWEGHSSRLAKPVARLWRETTSRPLKVFGSTDIFSYGVPFYLPGHPVPVHALEREATLQEKTLIEENGAALLCPVTDAHCLASAAALAASGPAGKQAEIEVSRRYLGVDGNPARYYLVTIPPRGS